MNPLNQTEQQDPHGSYYAPLTEGGTSDGKLVPAFDETNWPEGACPNLSKKGKNIPFITGDVKPRSIAGGKPMDYYSLMYTRGNAVWFWIPVKYLP
jgi:hypothetical protein